MLNKAIINLNKLVDNALAIKKELKKGVKFCAVVKADAYGHGACEVANALYPFVDSYAVALAEEGVELRLAGIDKDILCLNPPTREDAKLFVEYNLTATVYTCEHVNFLQSIAKKLERKVKVHVKFNAGMNRQGIDKIAEFKEFLEYLKSKKQLLLDGFYSHLSQPENKKRLKLQVNNFLLAKKVVKVYNNKATCHVSASGGFLSGVQEDMVRIGILLYGYKPFKSDKIKVEPIMKVYAPVLCTRRLKKGERALYGNCKSRKTQTVSLIRYGYADGLFRKRIRGQFNNRCMDLTAITKIPNGKYYAVMENAQKLAKRYKTISYEILTKCAMRAQKIYIR